MHNSNKTNHISQGPAHQDQNRPRRLPRPWIWAFLPAVVAAAVVLGLALGWFSPWPLSSAPQVKGEQWRVSLEGFQDGEARHFHHGLADGTKVRFFLLKSSDGTLRAALDACDVCWPQGKGYVQEGDYMVCKNCGRRFSSQSLGMQRGGCNPHPLAYRLEGKHLVIRLQELQEGARYFRLPGGSRS